MRVKGQTVTAVLGGDEGSSVGDNTGPDAASDDAAPCIQLRRLVLMYFRRLFDYFQMMLQLDVCFCQFIDKSKMITDILLLHFHSCTHPLVSCSDIQLLSASLLSALPFSTSYW